MHAGNDGRVSRRSFVLGSATAFAAAGCRSASPVVATAASRARILGSNAAVRIGVLGHNGRGSELTAGFRALPGVRIAALCDVDTVVLARAEAACRALGEAPRTFTDPRALLDSDTVDAVAIATPNHWHSLLGVWALERGLHAYVEKPVSHDVWEGAQLVAAAQRTGLVAASGTQCRSHKGILDAIAYAQSGALGRIRLARGLCYKPRTSIGKVAEPSAPPATVDYDLWLGPAAQQAVRRHKFHYDWHWQWPYGNGDLGNQGVHQMDLCRMAVGLDALPSQVWSVGGRFGADDDGETPNTQLVWIGSERAPILFEVRGLPASAHTRQMDEFFSARIGVVIHCEHGCVVLTSYYGGHAQDLEGKRIATFVGRGDHLANFIDAVRAGDPKRLAADVRQGHLSSALCHLGNESLRRGVEATMPTCDAALRSVPELGEAFLRMQQHLEDNALPSLAPLQLGALLRPDTDGNRHARRAYRAPFELKPQVAL
jgi:predicted dehydrogenase